MSDSPRQAARIRAAESDDVPGIYGLLLELAEYERLTQEIRATDESFREALFGPHPCAEAVVAEANGRLIGYALFFTSFSTFVGRPGIFLEDLYVQPHVRGQGIGRQLLMSVARLAVDRRCARLEWAVLDWNAPSIEFYKRLGARAMSEWTVYRLAGDDLAALGGSTQV